MSSSSSRRLRLRSRSRAVPPGSWRPPSRSPMAGSSSSSVVGTSTETAIEPRWNVAGAGRASSRWSVDDRRIRPPRWPRSSTGSGGGAVPLATWSSATSSWLSVPGRASGPDVAAVRSSTPRPIDDRRLLRLEHDRDGQVRVVVGDEGQAHPALVVGRDRAVVEDLVQERDERLALRVVGQHGAEPRRGVAQPARVGRAVPHDPERGGEVAQHAEVGGGDRHLSSGPSGCRA